MHLRGCGTLLIRVPTFMSCWDALEFTCVCQPCPGFLHPGSEGVQLWGELGNTCQEDGWVSEWPLPNSRISRTCLDLWVLYRNSEALAMWAWVRQELPRHLTMTGAANFASFRASAQTWNHGQIQLSCGHSERITWIQQIQKAVPTEGYKILSTYPPKACFYSYFHAGP